MPFGWNKRDTKAVSERSVPISAGAGSSLSDSVQVESSASIEAQLKRYGDSDLVYMCVNRVAEMCAMQAPKLHVYNGDSLRDDQTGIPEEEIEDHAFLQQWQRPSDWMSTFELLENWASVLQLTGNAYWHLDDGRARGTADGKVELQGVPLYIWPVMPNLITPVFNPKTYIDHYQYENGEKKIKFARECILHYKRFHPSRELLGMSPLEPANYPSATDICAQQANWALFKNQMRVSGVVESERDSIDIDQYDVMRRQFEREYQGDPKKAHKLLWLWSSFKYKDLGMNMRDAEYIEGSKLNRMRVFGVFGVHPAVILSEDANRANALVGEYVTLKFTVSPLLRRLASTLSPALKRWDSRFDNAEVHFPGVVPKDQEIEAKIALVESQSLFALIRALGTEEGLEEAKRRGIVSDDVISENVLPMLGGGSGLFGANMADSTDIGKSYP